MILRKPFALLIKYFKVIHLALTMLIVYSIIKTTSILSFFNEYIASNRTILGHGITDQLFNNFMYISIILIIMIAFIVFVLMKYKKKKSFFYFLIILIYVYNYILYNYAFNNVSILETGLVDIRTLKVIQDLYTTLLILQYITVVISLIRATGFNIKKFDFQSDIQELQITENDREEFLVNIEFDVNKIKANYKKNIRHLKYAYKENRMFVHLIILIIIGAICFALYYNFGVYNKVYKNGETFKTKDFIMNVKDVYITSNDYKNNNLFNNYKLVVVKINARGIYGDTVIDTSKFYIKKKSERYYVTSDYNKYVNDLGNIYNGDKLDTEFDSYNLVFKVPNDDVDELYLVYNESKDRNVKIKLDLIDLDIDKVYDEHSLNEEFTINNLLINNSKINISEFGISNMYVENYNFCVTNDNCYNSIEYIKPSITTHSNRAIVKLKGTYEFDESNNNEKLSTLSNLLINNAKIVYTIDGKDKESELYKIIKPSKIKNDYLYLEVLEEVMHAENLKLVITIRNNNYIYNLT